MGRLGAHWPGRPPRLTIAADNRACGVELGVLSMPALRRRSAVGVLAVVLLGNGCGADLPNDRRWTSDHFVFHTRTVERAACADILTLLEAHFTTMQAYLGFSWPQGRVVDYYKFVDKNDRDSNSDCGSGDRCTSSSAIQSDNAFDPHELIHAYLAPTGEPPVLFIEGAAVALSCQMAGRTRPSLQADAVLRPGVSSADLYTAGGWLVSYLVDEFGPAKLMSIYGQLESGMSPAQIDAVLAGVYGMPFADLWAAATAEDVPRSVCRWECSQPSISVGGGPMSTAAGACGQNTVQRTFSISESNLAVTADSAGFRVGDCGARANVPPSFVFGSAGAGSLYHLPAGDYFLEHSNQAGTITVAVADPTTLAPTCSGATAAGALAALDTVSVLVPRSVQTWFIPAVWSRDRSLIVVPTNGQGHAFLCPSCGGDPLLCAAASSSDPQSLSNVGAIRLEADPAVAMSGFLLFVH